MSVQKLEKDKDEFNEIVHLLMDKLSDATLPILREVENNHGRDCAINMQIHMIIHMLMAVIQNLPNYIRMYQLESITEYVRSVCDHRIDKRILH